MVAQYATKLWLSGRINRKFDSAEVLLSTTQIRERENHSNTHANSFMHEYSARGHFFADRQKCLE